MSTRRSSALTLAVAVVAVSTAVVGTVAAPSHAAETDRAAETTLSIRIPHARIEANQTTKVRGGLHVRGPGEAAGRVVTLEARPHGATSFTPVGTDVAGARGGLSLEVAPSVTTRYRWRYAGADDARPSRSGVARVVIVADQHHGHKIHTSLSIRAAHRVVGPDGSDVVRGRLRSHGVGLRHRAVSLLTRPVGSATPWQVAGQDWTDRSGAVAFRVAPTVRSAYRLRFEGTPVFHASRSGIVRIAVRPLVTAVATPGWLDPGQTATVSGLATLAGQPLAGATVDLLARPAGRKGPRNVVGSGTTAPDGSVTITDTPTRSTVYRLVVRHSAGVPRGVSDAVRVKVREPSSLSIRGRHTPSGFVVSGVLRGKGHPVRREPVSLETLAPDGTWTVVGADRTNRRGKVSLLAPNSEGASFRLSYAGGTRLAPCVSGTVVG